MTIDAAFTTFPTLTTNRLQLRQVRSTDAEHCSRYGPIMR